MVFPFLFLLEMLSEQFGWGPDCANPISMGDRDGPADNILHHQPAMLMFLFASIFGGIHFITWSFSMPTVTELWMWRSASIALTSFPILAPLFTQAAGSLDGYSDYLDPIVSLMLMLTLAFYILHPIIRLIIAVDSVVLLRSLPDSAFLVLSWSDAIPSF